MKGMKILLITLLVIMSILPIQAEQNNDRVVIAVTNQFDAWQPIIEEAFYKENPNVDIVYNLYATDQLKTILLSGKADFDLLIQPVSEINAYGREGYLEDLYPVLELDGWPEVLLNVRDEIEQDHALYGMPVAIFQAMWTWNDALAAAEGVAGGRVLELVGAVAVELQQQAGRGRDAGRVDVVLRRDAGGRGKRHVGLVGVGGGRGRGLPGAEGEHDEQRGDQ